MSLLLCTRPKFLTTYFASALLGASIAFKDGVFDPVMAILSLIGATIAGAACNAFNIYIDYIKGVDERDKQHHSVSAGIQVVIPY
ncbi:MAG: hypothetical protein BA066_05990 [Candidatus Korarchaeota archaeon NZ13-K]|nr:MAG: hypothetical protein BA066_05990 [Candidatus Korarchaeota archaeon NZ13-K]